MEQSLKDIIAELKEEKIKTVRVDFSGGGDEGAIDNTEFKPHNPRDKTLENRLEDEVYNYLEGKGDWYNNEGGGGTLEINVTAGTISCDMYFNEVHQNWNHFDG